jgi:serine/threonine protein kinase
MPIEENTSLIGSILDGKYQIESLIGTGGMGSVYAGTHIALGKRVAIKILHPWLAGDARSCQRFLQEAKAIGTLSHPNVVAVDASARDRDRIYIAMEYLEGEPLSDRIKRLGKLPAEDAVDVVLAAASGLGHAHAAGVLHRDVKPSNIMLCSGTAGDTVVKVVDFGIAKINQPDAQNLTSTNSAIGTPYYMSPEQGAHIELDARADVYSLGCVLFECVSGTVPFDGESPLAIMLAHMHSEPRDLPNDVPQWLKAVIAKAMNPNRDDRYQSMSEFIEALQSRAAAPPMVRRKKTSLANFRPDKKVLVGVCALLISLLAGLGFMLHTAKTAPVPVTEHLTEDECDRIMLQVTAIQKKGDELFAIGQFAAAAETYNKALSVGEPLVSGGPRDKKRWRLYTYESLVSTYVLQNNLAAAEDANQKWFREAEALEGQRSPFYGLALMCHGGVQFRKGNIAQARAECESAFELADEHCHSRTVDVLSPCLIIYARAADYYKEIDGPGAEEAIRKEIAVRRKSTPGAHAQIADAFHSLVRIQVFEGKFEGAEKSFASCLAEADLREPSEHAICKSSYLGSYALMLFGKAQYERALELIQAAEKVDLGIRDKAYQRLIFAEHQIWQVRLLVFLGRYEEAQKILDSIARQYCTPADVKAMEDLQMRIRKRTSAPVAS